MSSECLQRIKRRIFHNTWKLYDIQISVFVSKVLWEHNYTYLFICCLWLLSCYNSSVSVEYLWQKLYVTVNYFILLLSTLQITVMKSLCQHFECHTYHHTTTLYFIIFYYRTNIMLKWIKKKMKSRSWTSYF